MIRLFSLLPALLFFVPAPVSATVVMNWNLEQVIDHADSVVLATVGDHRVVRRDGAIFTETTIHVEQHLVGTIDEMFTLTQLGGELDGVASDVAGDIRLKRGKRVLLITSQREGRNWIVGLTLGAYAVSGDRFYQRVNVSLADRDGTLHPPPGGRSITLLQLHAAVAARGDR